MTADSVHFVYDAVSVFVLPTTTLFHSFIQFNSRLNKTKCKL